MRSKVSAVRSVHRRTGQVLPASTSISACSSSYRAVVVTNFSVGTNGKLVIEPLPVVKKIRLQPLRDLAGDRLEVVAGAVHEDVAVAGQRLAVVDHVVEPDLARQLAGGADRLQHDVVEPAVHVAAGRVALGRVTVPADAFLERLDRGRGSASRSRGRGRSSARTASAPISSSVSASTAVPPCRMTSRADLRRRAGWREIPEKASEPPHCRAILRSASGTSSRCCASTTGSQGSISAPAAVRSCSKPAAAGEVRVRHLDRRVAVLGQEVLDRLAGDDIALGVDDQDRADVRVQREAGRAWRAGSAGCSGPRPRRLRCARPVRRRRPRPRRRTAGPAR